METPSVSVIMPALNEEQNISSAINNTLKAFQDFEINGEIIVVNDGSTDDTEKFVKNIMEKNNRVRLIKNDSPKGIGASFWGGFDISNADAVIMLPGDNENDPWEIFRYYRLLEHVDIVIPFLFNRETRSSFRNALSLIYRLIINTTFRVNFNYTNGTILYRKSILKELPYRSSSFFFQTDILIRTVKKGYLFAEVPYKLGSRNEGVSKAVSFPSLLKVMKGYLNLVKDYYWGSNMKNDRNFMIDSLTAARRGKTNND